MREHGNQKGGSFPRAGLSLTRDILAFQQWCQGLGLNRGAVFKANFLNASEDGFREFEISKAFF